MRLRIFCLWLLLLVPSSFGHPICEKNETYHLFGLSEENARELIILNLCNNRKLLIETANSILSIAYHPKDDIILYLATTLHLLPGDNEYKEAYAIYLSLTDFHQRALHEQIEHINEKYWVTNPIDPFKHSLTDSHRLTFLEKQLQPSFMTIDWVNDLLYLVAEQNKIYVSSLRSQKMRSLNLLLSRQSAVIQHLIVCEQQQILLWHEIDWSGLVNENRLQLSLLDGTEVFTIHSGMTHISELRIDQEHSVVYFYTNQMLFTVQLKAAMADIRVRAVREFRASHYAVVNQILFELFENYLQKSPVTALSHHSYSENSMEVGSFSAFTIVHDQTEIEYDTYCKDIECENFCIPNGKLAKYNCFCWLTMKSCTDFGLYETIKPVEDVEKIEMEYEAGKDNRTSKTMESTSTTATIVNETLTTKEDTSKIISKKMAENDTKSGELENISFEENFSHSKLPSLYTRLTYQERIVFIYGLLGTLFVFVLTLLFALVILRWYYSMNRKVEVGIPNNLDRTDHKTRKSILGLSFRSQSHFALKKLDKAKDDNIDEKIRKFMLDRYVPKKSSLSNLGLNNFDMNETNLIVSTEPMPSDYVIPCRTETIKSESTDYINTRTTAAPGANNWEYQYRTSIDVNNNATFV